MRFTTNIKRLIYPLYILPRVTSGRRNQLHKLFKDFQEGKSKINDTELRVFSNMEEDGIILQLLASLNIKKGYFLDIGSNDCINSNCANLAFNFDWSGLFIDADDKLLKVGERNYKLFGKSKRLRFANSILHTENVNEVVLENIEARDIDFMSIDVDGNDYALWKALVCVKPKIVVIENKIEYGNYNIVIPVKEPFSPIQWGASIASITKLAEAKGYTLVATNKEGFNAFYIHNDYVQTSGLEPLLLDDVFLTDRIKKNFYPAQQMDKLLEEVRKGDYHSASAAH